MRGQEHVIRMRLAGKAPRSVSLDDFPVHPWALAPSSQYPTVCIDGDRPELADLRFLADLHIVTVVSDRLERAQAWLRAIAKVQPRTAVASCGDWLGMWRKDENLFLIDAEAMNGAA